jgi:O-antigen biosynthesis alpha-1,2-mannosyltransferase
VAGPHAFFFSGTAPADLALAVTAWLLLFGADQHPRSDDMQWLSWQQSANQLMSRIPIA